MANSKKHKITGIHSFTLSNKTVWGASCTCGNFAVILHQSKNEAIMRINKHIKEKTGKG